LVVDTTGLPVSGTLVRIYNGTENTGFECYTDERGMAHIKSTDAFTLTPESYRFSIYKDGARFWSESFNHCRIPSITITNIVLGSG